MITGNTTGTVAIGAAGIAYSEPWLKPTPRNQPVWKPYQVRSTSESWRQRAAYRRRHSRCDSRHSRRRGCATPWITQRELGVGGRPSRMVRPTYHIALYHGRI